MSRSPCKEYFILTSTVNNSHISRESFVAVNVTTKKFPNPIPPLPIFLNFLSEVVHTRINSVPHRGIVGTPCFSIERSELQRVRICELVDHCLSLRELFQKSFLYFRRCENIVRGDVSQSSKCVEAIDAASNCIENAYVYMTQLHVMKMSSSRIQNYCGSDINFRAGIGMNEQAENYVESLRRKVLVETNHRDEPNYILHHVRNLADYNWCSKDIAQSFDLKENSVNDAHSSWIQDFQTRGKCRFCQHRCYITFHLKP